MQRTVNKLMKKFDQLSDEERMQLNLHLYLQSVIDDFDWTVEDLAKSLGIGYSTVARIKNPTLPTKIVKNILELKPIADLKGFSIDSMVSILLGNLNEDGESGGVFDKELSDHLEQLPNMAKVRLAGAIMHHKEELTELAETIELLTKAGPGMRNWVKFCAKNLTEKDAKSLLKYSKSLKEGDE